MKAPHAAGWTRRRVLGGLTLAGTAGFLGLESDLFAAEPPPETTTVRLMHAPTICTAPEYLAEEFLRGEGFTDVQYVKRGLGGGEREEALASGEVHLSMGLAARHIIRVDAGDPLVLLTGVHVGCYELFATDRARAIRDLRGKTVAVPGLGSPQHVFLSIMIAYVGLDPRKEINWVTHPPRESMRLLAERKIDVFLAYPPEPQELRAKQVGHVVVNTMMDRPWSQYFCCVVAANKEFVRKNPVATKRALRAILRATDVCALEPARVARFLVDRGYTENYEYALQTMQELPYGKWREYDSEDTVRFYALRLQEVGMIKSSPQRIITQGTDWRFLNELKRELKG
jgi:NitT/TauT family transport system substrate-binding protein